MTPQVKIHKAVPPAGLVTGLLAVSFAGVLIKLCGMNPFLISAMRTLAGGLILLPFALPHLRGDLAKLSRREKILLVAAGLLMALHFVSWVTAAQIMRVGSAMMVFGAQPVFAGIVAHFFLRERFCAERLNRAGAGAGGDRDNRLQRLRRVRQLRGDASCAGRGDNDGVDFVRGAGAAAQDAHHDLRDIGVPRRGDFARAEFPLRRRQTRNLRRRAVAVHGAHRAGAAIAGAHDAQLVDEALHRVHRQPLHARRAGAHGDPGADYPQ